MQNSVPLKILSATQIKVRSFKCSAKGQLILTISTYDSETNEHIQDVYRTLTQIENLNNYIIGTYGGHIIPILDGELAKRLGNKGVEIQQILDNVQVYLKDLRENSYAGADGKFYCFVFEQAMMLPKQQLYTKVLRSASKISKKYLNAIFTRKQVPQQKAAQTLVTNFMSLSDKFSELSSLKHLCVNLINQQRTNQQILSYFSELSGVPASSPCPYEDLILQTEKVIKTADIYMLQATEAYERWEVLIERVRELQSNLFKGLHQDQGKYKIAAEELKKWTATLGEQMKSLKQCFIVFIDLLIKFVDEIKWGSGLALEQQQKRRQASKRYQSQIKEKTYQLNQPQNTINGQQNQNKQQQIGTETTLDEKLEGVEPKPITVSQMQ